MLIRNTFATKIEERIEPVVKVADRSTSTLLNELTNLVITPQWERYLHRILEEYADAFEREDEQRIGIWISGFFGSGKSLLMKILGLLLQGGELAGQSIHQIFLDHLPASSAERADLQRFLAVCQRRISTSSVGGNLHAKQSKSSDTLALIVFKLFAEQHGYTYNWPFAWAIEYQLDTRNLSGAFRAKASALSGIAWPELARDPDFYSEHLYEAAAQMLPENFSNAAAVVQAVTSTNQNGITPEMLIERMRRWCAGQDREGRRHKLLLQLDELGQWLNSGNNATERAMQVQALAETASVLGQGRIWIAITAHGDVQALRQNVQQELYAKINQRFALQCKLSNEDINQVVQERLLRKTQPAGSLLRDRFNQRSGELIDLGTLQPAQHVYPVPTAENISQFYPYLPWTVAVIPDVVKGIAQATGREEALTGSNRTMIGIVQGGIIDTRGLLDSPVGRLLCLADLYRQLEDGVPVETKTELNRLSDTVAGATAFTTRVAYALFLLGQATYISCTLDNVSRALVDAFDANLSSLRAQVREELERLVFAGYVKHVGEIYVFLSTQQRSFQDKVSNRQDELNNQTYDLSLKLKDYEGDDALRFDRVSMSGLQGREKLLRLELDGRVIRNPSEPVTIHVYSPLQRILEPEVANDLLLKQRSTQESNDIFFRMDAVKGFQRALAQAAATEEIIDQVLRTANSGDPEREVARQVQQQDLDQYRKHVRSLLAQAVRGGTIFFRGSAYQLIEGDNASTAVRNTLGQLLPIIYARFHEVPQRINSEEAAVKAALNGNTSNADLQALGVYKSDGTLNESHALLSTLKGKLPQVEDDMGAISADTLRSEFERPPYGWDGNCVKVGLALLLRESACRLLSNGRVLTDPNSPDVVQLLTKTLSFKSLRVQGVRSELTTQELLTIRGYMDTIFSVKPQVVAAILNDKLGERLETLKDQAQSIENWAATANCPLPLTFESGNSLVVDMLNSPLPSVRLPLFLREWESVQQYVQQVQDLTCFKNEHGKQYVTVRDFFNTMVNADALPEAVRTFIRDWHVVSRERNVTDAARWGELLKAYHAAQQAVTDQISAWHQEALQGLTEIEKSLKDRVLSVGVPASKADEQVAVLNTELKKVRQRLERPDPSFSEAKTLPTELATARMNVLNKVAEIRSLYQQENVPQLHEVRLTWGEVAGPVRLTSPGELDQLVTRLKKRLGAELEQQRIVIIE